MKVLVVLTASLFLTACAAATNGGNGGPRQVGTVMDPYCAPDGSVVRLIYPNTQGSFEGSMASRENCPWNK